MGKVNENSSKLILIGNSGNRLLLSQYDSTYPKKLFRNRVNLLGGAKETKDQDPLDTIIRELTEEINRDEREGYLPKSLSNDLFEIVMHNIKHYKDFLSIIKEPKEDVNVDSVFVSKIPDNLLRYIDIQLQKGKRLLTEGLEKIVTLDDLKRGEPLTAWSTAEILSDFFRVEIPNPERVVLIPLKGPLRNHTDYRELFEYLP